MNEKPARNFTVRYGAALAFADAKHRNHVRKGTDIPYISHLLSVSALVMEHGGDEDQAIAGLLHDVIEDRGGSDPAPLREEIAANFGERVLAIVAGCSDGESSANKPDWETRKRAYLEHLGQAPTDVLLVSCADKLHNARAILADYREIGESLWARFTVGKRFTEAILSTYGWPEKPGQVTGTWKRGARRRSGTTGSWSRRSRHAVRRCRRVWSKNCGESWVGCTSGRVDVERPYSGALSKRNGCRRSGSRRLASSKRPGNYCIPVASRHLQVACARRGRYPRLKRDHCAPDFGTVARTDEAIANGLDFDSRRLPFSSSELQRRSPGATLYKRTALSFPLPD